MAAAGSDQPSKKMKSNEEADTAVSFTPRDYQIEILETAKKENTIACLGTGTGKTFIAVMLIRESSQEVRLPFQKGGKRIFFLVPTVPLVYQQQRTIDNHTDLKVKGYCGEMEVDSWNKDHWTVEFKENQVLVMTAEIFRIIVDHTLIPLNKIQLIILDECHRANGDHPYRQALKCFTALNEEEMPRIFGLSASLLNGKCRPSQLENNLENLEKTLRAKITTASDITDLKKYGTDPKEYIVYYMKYAAIESKIVGEMQEMVNNLKMKKEKKEKGSKIFTYGYMDEVIFFDKPIKCMNSLKVMFEGLGPWCTAKAADIYLKELGTMIKKCRSEDEKEQLLEIESFLLKIVSECEKLEPRSNGFSVQRMPNKLKRLLNTFSAVRKSSKFKYHREESMDCSFEDDPLKHMLSTKSEPKTEGEMQLCSIIFVEQRITAYVLYEWFLAVKMQFPELDFIKPQYIVGHGNAGFAVTSMSEKIQRKKLEAFRKEECNVLIATSVLEEGMDIRQCNVVVRFDLPKDYRSYIQSKGRARAKNSIYVMLLEEGPDAQKFVLDICDFKTIEDLLLKKCHGREMQTEEDINAAMSDDLIPPYMPYGPRGPRITMTASISLINRYCSNLPSDMATKLVPQWAITAVEPDSIETEYECTLQMPINSPLRQKIVGEAMRRKRLAKMSAALKACKLLDEIGELNENLVPSSCLVDNALKEELGELQEEEEDCGGAQPGTNRRRQVYDKQIPSFLVEAKPTSEGKCYLHILDMDLVEPLSKVLNPRNRPIENPADSPRTLAILTSTKLPSVNSFRVFTKSGKIQVTMSVLDNGVMLTDEDIQRIEEFHTFIFDEALWLKKDSRIFEPCPSSYYIVPVNRGQTCQFKIDWKFMQSTKNHTYNQEMLKTKSSVNKTIFQEETFHDAVLLRSYKIDCWSSERPTFHHVIRILPELTPLSPLDIDKAGGMNYKDYYKQKYGMDITYNNQPLVETVQHGSLHLWKPLYVSPKETFDSSIALSKSKQRHRSYREYLVPELCIVHPFPSSFFKKVVCLPTILYRLNGLLLAEEIRRKIASHMGIGAVLLDKGTTWPPFYLETSDKALRDHLNSIGELKVPIPNQLVVPVDITKDPEDKKYIKSFQAEVDLVRFIGPNPSLLLQALTAKGVGDEFDLERLEMIGDSFLKYTMSIKTYFKFRNFDEGKLTKVRSALIQNLRLYQQAKKKNLGKYLMTSLFSCSKTWLPPCYAVEEVVNKKTLIGKTKAQKQKDETKEGESNLHLYFTKQVISDKCVADAVEALIGCYLLSCGQQGALKFMHWFGLKPLIEINPTDSDFASWPPPPLDPIVAVDMSEDEKNYCLDKLTSGLDKFEKIINYTFKNKAFLVQAFTHPSYFFNKLTDCYQRLEFLGDAVLDYLVTRQLYEDPSNHSPGELTDLRSALVNNNYFACLAVKHKYHEFLMMLSPGLFRLLENYITQLESNDHFKFFVENGYMLDETECFDITEVEVPKALGDVFESVAGAIYLDSAMSLDTVWEVVKPMIKPAFDHMCVHVPKSPVRELYELAKTQNVFQKDCVQKDGKTYVKAYVKGREFCGVGPNKKVAKQSAAKRALKELKETVVELIEFETESKNN